MTTTHTRTRRDIEASIGVDSIDVLLDARRDLMADLAPLRARYGPGGTWDARRKAHRSAIANELAQTLAAERGKAPSEAELERLSAAHPKVLAMLDEAENDMARFHVLTDEVEAVTETIMRDAALIRYAASEPK